MSGIRTVKIHEETRRLFVAGEGDFRVGSAGLNLSRLTDVVADCLTPPRENDVERETEEHREGRERGGGGGCINCNREHGTYDAHSAKDCGI